MATLFSLEVLPADEGDCLLLHWGDAKLVGLIDGGPSKVYAAALRKRLLALREKLAVTTLPLAFVMISHVDNDHILGVKKLFADLRKEVENNVPKGQRPLKVERLWHNAFTDILGDSLDAYYDSASLAALAAHSPTPDPAEIRAALSAAGLDDSPEAFELAVVLAGHAEGRTIRDAYEILYQTHDIQVLNAPFARTGRPTPIMRMQPSEVTPVEGLNIQVLGPSKAELVKLKTDFEAYLTDNGLVATAALAAAIQRDSSPTNLSSIVCLVEYEGRRILLTGDALGDKVLEGLKETDKIKNGRVEVDILKVPHHGSARNTAPPFFDTIRAKTYVISANGRHSNPDRQAIEWLIASRDKADAYLIVFTYPVEVIDAKRQSLQSDWVPDRDAIGALLARCKAEGYAFSYREGHAVLDIGDIEMHW
ncbi:hypothetical protein C1T17_12175 [Sphingobium sp. SCG-1]|uniref:ComEC/Rec2 family competence protein n=1 Tax=Sphingobium sp. SCG-1 TaxID=2072936 RepID=UPI000CD6C4E4|nr:hypothetical protein [Sphingobium sp. SCG-1]AUW58742.1 hypothetical protein C1T17_12175 [Sphingobium sp. SCG-1]